MVGMALAAVEFLAVGNLVDYDNKQPVPAIADQAQDVFVERLSPRRIPEYAKWADPVDNILTMKDWWIVWMMREMDPF